MIDLKTNAPAMLTIVAISTPLVPLLQPLEICCGSMVSLGAKAVGVTTPNGVSGIGVGCVGEGQDLSTWASGGAPILSRHLISNPIRSNP